MIMSDIIEQFIKELFQEEKEFIEIQRNDLAEQFDVVPSQINYVIATRFTPKQGYYVESKRGGGGSIKIKKVHITKANYLMHIITNIENTLSQNEINIFLTNFLSYDIVSETEAKLIKVATSDKVLTIDQNQKDKLRANIFKNMLLNLVED